MFEYQGQTNQVHIIKLDSTIEQAMWMQRAASPGQVVKFAVYTHFVGDGSDIRVRFYNNSGKRLGEVTGKVYGSKFSGKYLIPDRARNAIYFEAELKRHKLNKRSEEMKIIPPIVIKNAIWGQPEARRGEIVELTADVLGAQNGTEALIEIYEYDEDGTHDFITKFLALVEGKRIEAKWEFQYYEDVGKIPIAEESESGYRIPRYFFRVKIDSIHGESNLIEFRDWIEIEASEDGNPVPNLGYVLHLPDGSRKEGRLDANGYAKEDHVPPGKVSVEFSGT